MSRLDQIIEKVAADKRIDADEALTLLREADLLLLGDLANRRRCRLHPKAAVTFVVDRNINYTNICTSGCRFCAFYKAPDDPQGYVISRQALSRKIEETLDLDGTQILLQGGMNPALQINDYLEMLRYIKTKFPVHIHGFSPPEIHALAMQSNLSTEDVLRQLIDAGLDSIPGGGAEILVDEIRERVSPGKCTADEWLALMQTAHKMGLRSSATMMFGHLESDEHIIEHLLKIRGLQDETGGFTAFIPWTFQPQNTRIDVTPKTSVDYLRVLALSRLVLDNIDNIQASWVTQGEKIAQVALVFGANDFGSTMITAMQRDCFYNIIKRCD